MHISWGFCIDSVLLFLNALAFTSVLPRGDKRSNPDEIQSFVILPHRLSQGSYKGRNVPVRSADAMTKRDDDEDDDLRIRRIEIVAGSIPIATAAHSLEMFYNAILSNALAPWCNQPPQQALVMTMGPLQLTMNVVLNHGVPQGIPWAFVRNFARNMLAMTSMGFAGSYNMYYSRLADHGLHFDPNVVDLGVEVRLSIMWGM